MKKISQFPAADGSPAAPARTSRNSPNPSPSTAGSGGTTSSARWPTPHMLHKIGVLTKKELRAIVRGLDAIGREIAAGKFKWKPELEDVHMNIEAELTRRVPAGAKLHTARSRNDQVALDMRLWLRDEIVAVARRNRRFAARARLARRKKCRRADSRLHASATRAARLSRAPSARLRRDAGTRLRAALGLSLARERLPARQRRDCRLHAAARPRARRQTARLRGRERQTAAHAKFHGRRQRPRFRRRILRRRRVAGRSSFAARGRFDSLGQRGIQFHQDRRRLHHRLVAHAAKEKSRHRRTRARQDPAASSATSLRCSRC